MEKVNYYYAINKLMAHEKKAFYICTELTAFFSKSSQLYKKTLWPSIEIQIVAHKSYIFFTEDCYHHVTPHF